MTRPVAPVSYIPHHECWIWFGGREAALPKAEKQAQERTVPNGRKSEVLSCLNLWVSQLISFASVQSVARNACEAPT